MAATNIFYRIPSQRGTRIATIAGPGCTLHQFCDYIVDCEGLDLNEFIIASGTKIFRPNSCCLQSINLQNNSNVDILIPLLGGKGGFGSLLRAIGAQIEKTTNRDACRDLSGRRLRDIKQEDELKKLIALQERLQEERKRRKKEKLEKLKKTVDDSSSSASIQELVAMFDDHAFNKRRLELSDIIEAAVDKGIINFKKRQQERNSSCSSNRVEDEVRQTKRLKRGLGDDPEIEESREQKSKPSQESANKSSEDQQSVGLDEPSRRANKAKEKDDWLWLGLDDDDDDNDDDDDDTNI